MSPSRKQPTTTTVVAEPRWQRHPHNAANVKSLLFLSSQLSSFSLGKPPPHLNLRNKKHNRHWQEPPSLEKNIIFDNHHHPLQ
ncbi:hypothetical protein HanXRQr2_Chr01g0045761 [Helianthus annuus]|uniref:Uncharacterized protein n=1 Tax=Helianthus annuus TaxID=4232 RepID=A0A9K3JZF4_HELAN|nr:hypothetical protein HanXRQr2_Chr01g0045761 [Helianthus annuus]KAJ0625185.1 hypothetical protein HanIR_Chr01g0051021 [Helianthus annuus]